jgi:hypothetical protein
MIGGRTVTVGGSNLHYRRNTRIVSADTLIIGANTSLSAATP